MKAGEIGELFAKAPAEFTAARNALAKKLRGNGDEEGAKRVLALRRPTAALWATNQLARRAPDHLAALLESTDTMRKMQARGGGGDDLRAAMGDQRAALARLESAAQDALREAGLSASQAVLRTVQRTLQAAAAGDRDLREALRKGALEAEQEPTGFEALLGAAPVATAHKPAKERGKTRSKADDRKAAAEARRREKEVAKESARQEREVKAAEALVHKLEEEAEKADRAANEARDRAREARSKLHELRSRQ